MSATVIAAKAATVSVAKKEVTIGSMSNSSNSGQSHIISLHRIILDPFSARKLSFYPSLTPHPFKKKKKTKKKNEKNEVYNIFPWK